MLNPFFLNGSNTEQSLVQDLINEQLKMYGVEVYYLPRRYVTSKTVIQEVIQSSFKDAYPIEAYVDNYEGYSGQGSILSKFGIENRDDLQLIISKERFENYITPLTENLPDIELTSRPKEGDLIYFPLGDRLFEIKFVEHEQPFYQLKKTYVYELKCELFRYEDEIIDTNVDEIDDEIAQIGYIQTLTLIGSGRTATATPNICTSGSISGIRMTNMGRGYTSTPTVGFSSAPDGEITATGIASVSYVYPNCDGKSGRVEDINITNAGCGYDTIPLISIRGGGGAGATAKVVGLAKTGSVYSLTIGDGGSGYISAPTVGISTPTHVGAEATAVIGAITGYGASVVSAPISTGPAQYLFPGGTTGGVFYKSAPTVTFSPPTGTGQGAQATATLDDYNTTGGTILSLTLTDEGKFYTSAPSVTISHPGYSFASAVVGLAGSSIDPNSLVFTSTGRAYLTAPTVTVGTGVGTVTPIETAVGIATINPITGVVTAISFNESDPWAVGTGATIGIGYTVDPSISFSGSPSPINATASVTVSAAGSVTSISIGNSGYGYASTPTVSIASPTGINTEFTATGIATIRFNSVSSSGTISTTSSVITGINTSNIVVGDRVRLGIGYSDYYNFIPSGTYVTNIGLGSIFISQQSTNVSIASSTFEFGIDRCGIVTGIIITNGGGGYIETPTVTISNDVSFKNYVDVNPGVATATARASVSTAGIVTAIYIVNSGSQYVLTPTVTISAPAPITNSSGIGTFIFNEIIVGQTSGTTARVKEWNETTNKLEVSIVDGEFTPGEAIVGSDSNASYTLSVQNTDDIVTPYADNDIIEFEADSIIDFSTSNPFGMP